MRLTRGSILGVVPLAAVLAFGQLVRLDDERPETPSYERIDGDAEPLRSAFNADVGKVRILMLVAPT